VVNLEMWVGDFVGICFVNGKDRVSYEVGGQRGQDPSDLGRRYRYAT
jgi:hypothetical protein